MGMASLMKKSTSRYTVEKATGPGVVRDLAREGGVVEGLLHSAGDVRELDQFGQRAADVEA